MTSRLTVPQSVYNILSQKMLNIVIIDVIAIALMSMMTAGYVVVEHSLQVVTKLTTQLTTPRDLLF